MMALFFKLPRLGKSLVAYQVFERLLSFGPVASIVDLYLFVNHIHGVSPGLGFLPQDKLLQPSAHTCDQRCCA